MKRTLLVATITCALIPFGSIFGQQSSESKLTAGLLRNLQLRSIGPAFLPGRVADVAVDPRNRSVWYVATASSGLWKTSNRGLTWTPIFDEGGSYSLGCVTLDPKNPDVVWLGTGENQALRSVSFGDGLYKSIDGGKTWKHTGLRNSEHIGKILVDPRNSQVVLVASQGPLWAPGGDQGLYKTTDGGETWKPVLQVSENTGITDICFDPRNPDVIYAASYQRRRHVGLLIGGGPEAGIFKSVDGGATWQKLTNGIPNVDLGRIALAVSPQQPDIVYALIVAAGRDSGFFRSEDHGATWTKQSNYRVVDPQYYGEIYPDPHKFDRVYAVDVTINVTEDGGKRFQPVRWNIHADNHAMVFDPTDADHLLVGNDGGLYETHDGGRAWRNFNNLPSAQFYHLAVDNSEPFYYVYGGAQDNGSQGGPSRTVNRAGIRTSDWIAVGGADGMQPRVDPVDANIVYSMSQNGAISRLDKRTGVSSSIRPRVPEDGPRVRWNWNCPFVISPHSPTRLYLAGSRLFRSEDRGDNWTAISPDLTRQIDRDTLQVMGRLWDSNAVTRNLFTSEYGVATAFSESPRQEGLLYLGTDDGLVQVSEDGGKNWRKIENFPGVPEKTLVSDLVASAHDANTVYAAFNNNLFGDFKPYLLRSTDRGRTWTSVAGNLPLRHFVWSLVEDHVNKDLLFVGTEFGLFFTADGGKQWTQLSGGMPIIAVRDLEIQRRETDLVCATFGRGFFILDDYTPLRHLTPDTLAKEGALFPLRHAYVFNEIGYVRAVSGNHTIPNPDFGAAITYFLRDDLTNDARIVLTVADAGGREIRKLNGARDAGLHRVTWDLRGEAGAGAGQRGGRGQEATSQPDEEEEEKETAGPQSAEQSELRREGAGAGAEPQDEQEPAGRGFGRGRGAGRGGFGAPPVGPGQYKVTLTKVVNDVVTILGEPQTFEVKPLPGVPAVTANNPAPGRN